MARPKNKAELLIAAKEGYDKLQKMIEGMNQEEMATPFDFSQDLKKNEAHWHRDKNLRDVLMHLYEWHRLTLNWVWDNQAGKRTPFLPEGYNWKSYGAMNVLFWQNCQQVPLVEAKQKLDDSHSQMLALIDALDDEELFTKAKYDWAGTSSIGQYMISATSSHYDWAMNKLKAHKKNVNATK